jgi:retron-type reverse transcriptase
VSNSSTALLHHLSIDLLRESFYALQRKASPGVDGVTWQEYETGLEDRLIDLHSRVHRGTYRAKPSRRVFFIVTIAKARYGSNAYSEHVATVLAEESS